ncbi:MAG TPA: glycosyltransferase family 4 protein [bacterium]|nr:glycosyltransferase family 4 protein [bacterium]HQI48763.1 glycosyltransferase family 4 protein [bacterium]HQJ66126.1 glycosyltransferase family 4 protein [bacterium]
MKDEILLVGPVPPQIGGVEFFIAALLKSPLNERFRLRHFDISKPRSRNRDQFDSPMGYARSFRRDFLTSFFSFGYSFLFFIRYLFTIPDPRIGLVHLHASAYMSFWEKCAYLDVAKLWGKKVVLHIHGSGFDRFIRESGPCARRAIVRHLRRCDRVVALSQSWKTLLLNYLPAVKVAVIENGIDLSLFRDLQPTPAPVPTILFLGEVCGRKGVYDLLPAFRRVLEQLPEARCVLIGPGELEEVRAAAQELGITAALEIAGPKWHREKAEALSRGWLFALPSHAEVFPLALLEAYAAGLPVVSTMVGGIPDFVHDGENGFLIAPGDREGLAAALSRLLCDRALRQIMAENNRRLAWERYDISLCAEKIGALYSELLKQASSA